MIIDVHGHMVVNGTVQGDYIRGAQKSFSMMYRKVHSVPLAKTLQKDAQGPFLSMAA